MELNSDTCYNMKEPRDLLCSERSQPQTNPEVPGVVEFTENRMVVLREVDGEYLKETISVWEIGMSSVPVSYTSRNDEGEH